DDMKKRKFKRFRNKHRNAAPPRNAVAPTAPRVARAARANGPVTPLHRLSYTAAGAAGPALLGALLARDGRAPKTVASALTAVGAGLAWKGDSSTVQSVGSGAMSAAGGQLALMVLDEQQLKKEEPKKKPANADTLPPGSLESAFERARARLALM